MRIHIYLILFCTLFALNGKVFASTTYTLPANIGTAPFNNCSLAGTTITCNGDVNLGNNVNVIFTGSVALIINNGDLTVGNNSSINGNGSGFSVTISTTNGDMQIGNSFTGAVNLNASGDISIGRGGGGGAGVAITGNVYAGGNLSITSGTVTGSCSPAVPGICTAGPVSSVSSIICTSTCTTAVIAPTVSWTVTFSKSVTGVSDTAFTLVSTGLSGAFISSVTGSGTNWTVTANTGIGSAGTLQLNQTSAGSISPGLTGTFTGQTYTSVTAKSPLALYHMDEAVWTGTSGQVKDSSGNGNNATAINGATTAATSPLPAISTNPGTCNYGEMTHGSVTNGYIQTPLPHLTTDFTVAAWIYPTKVNYIGSRIFVDDTGSHGYGLSIDDGAGHLRFYDRGINSVILDSTYALANNNWYFVAAVADITNKTRYIYVFNSAGTLLNVTKDATPFTGTWTTDNGTVNIGSSESYFFQGNIDEVQVFQKVLSQAALASLAGQTHACSMSGPDHILITHDGNGLTCTPETLTITACGNAACTSTYNATNVTGNVTWIGSPGGSVPFSIAVGGTGTATVSLPVTTVQAVTLGTNSVSPSPIGTTVTSCDNTSTGVTNTTSSCSLPFASSGLLFSSPNYLVSGIASTGLTISAVRSSNNGLNCVPAFQSVTRTVNLKCSYTNPNSGTLPALVAGSALNSTNSAISACDGSGQNISLSFGPTGVASPTLQYNDVGQVTLSGTYTGSSGTGDAGLTMTGTGSFIAAPASFGFSSITGSPIKAGNSFNATVTALNARMPPAKTANFGKETPSPEGVTLSFTNCQPQGTNSNQNGTFSGNITTAFGATVAGQATATINYGEVGNIDLKATLASGSYLGSGLTASGSSSTIGTVATVCTGGIGNVGTFIPDHFTTTVTDGCTGCGFTYSGQPFTVVVTAMNGLTTPAPTINYDGTANTSPNFANNVTLSDANAATTPVGVLGVSTTSMGVTVSAPTLSVPKADFKQGVATLTSVPTYTFNPVTPSNPIANTVPNTIKIRAVDSVNSAVTSSGFAEGTTQIRNGRVYIPNMYGSELLPLSMPVTAQYYSSSGWVTSITDSQTSLAFPGSYPIGGGATTVTKSPSTGILANGLLTLNLSAPGAGNVGSTLVAPTAASQLLIPYLPLMPPSGGTATFGIYKGNNSIIYMRENY